MTILRVSVLILSFIDQIFQVTLLNLSVTHFALQPATSLQLSGLRVKYELQSVWFANMTVDTA